MKCIKAKYLYSNLFEVNGKKDFFYIYGYLKLIPNKEYFLLVNENKDIIMFVEK